MNVFSIQEELLALSPAEQDQVSAFLVSVRLKRDFFLLKVMSDRLNDPAPQNWVSWDELKPELENDFSGSE